MCLLGMATKEVMVSAPLIVLLYDRTFCAGSFREAWRRRYGLYLCLAATWLLLGWLVISTGNRGGSAGFGVRMSCWAYLGTQFGAIVHYLKLCVWPYPLLFDYGQGTAQGVMEIAPYAILVGVLVVATVVAVWRWPKVGFLGAWFFAILAPSSTVVPVATQTIAEHRMYLPLAAVICGLVVGGFLAGRWLVRRGKISLLASQVMGGALTLLAGVALGILTFQRNVDYRSELSIWEDTVAKAPGNERAHYNLGKILGDCRRFDEAITQYRTALKIKPDYPEAYYNLGLALSECGRLDEAIVNYRKALEIKPVFAAAYNNLGAALAGRGQFDEAIASCRKALAIAPNDADTYSNFGMALAGAGRMEDAIAEYRKAVEINPNEAKSHYNLGNALVNCQRIDEAITQYEKALQIEPNLVPAHNNFGTLLARIRRFDEAIAQYEKSLQLKPDSAKTHNNLGLALMECGRFDEATSHFQRALELKPDYTDAHNNLGIAQSRREEILKALAGRRESLRARPDDVALLNDTAWMLATNPNASIRNGPEAVELAQRAARLSDARESVILGTLAAAYAEAGRFPEAVETAQKPCNWPPNRASSRWQNPSRPRFRFTKRALPFARCNQHRRPVQPGLEDE